MIKDEAGKCYTMMQLKLIASDDILSQFYQDNNIPAYTASKAPHDSFTDITFSYDNVFKAIMDLKAKPSKGPDGLPSFFIKHMVRRISFPLMLMFFAVI